jgi:hypothetical protein
MLPFHTRFLASLVLPLAIAPLALPQTILCVMSSPSDCPCGNASAPAELAGCANSTGLGGALRATVSGPSASWTASHLPASSAAILIRGTGAGAGVVFGDGTLCAQGSLLRLGLQAASAGVASWTTTADPGVYQAYYRNAVAAFCPPATFNVTNGVQLP